MNVELNEELLERVRAFAARRLPGDADPEDVVQEAALRLVQQGSRVSDPGAWLWRAVRNLVADFYRSRRGRTEPLEKAGELTAPPADSDEAFHSLARCLGPLLVGLSGQDRAVLEQVELQGLPQAELARRLGLAPSTVKSRAQRARRRLREALEACCEIRLDGRARPIHYERRGGPECPCNQS